MIVGLHETGFLLFSERSGMQYGLKGVEQIPETQVTVELCHKETRDHHREKEPTQGRQIEQHKAMAMSLFLSIRMLRGYFENCSRPARPERPKSGHLRTRFCRERDFILKEMVDRRCSKDASMRRSDLLHCKCGSLGCLIWICRLAIGRGFTILGVLGSSA